MSRPPHMIKDVRPTLYIGGNAHRNWLRYTINKGFFIPADSWSVSLGLSQKEPLPAWFKLWADVEIFFDETIALVGRVDRIRHSITRNEHQLDLSGRDSAGMLLDCSAPIFVTQAVTLPELVATIVRPLGIKDIDVDLKGTTLFRKITVEPGITAWEAIKEAARVNGLWAWFNAKGTLVIGRPDYTTEPVDQLVLRDSGVGNNILEITLEENIVKQYSAVTILSQNQGNELSQAVNSLQSVAVDMDVPFRPKLIRKGHLDNLFFTKNVAEGYLDEGKLQGLVIIVKLQGHFTEGGVLWAQGQRVKLVSEPHDIDEVFFITSCTFSGSRLGTFTTLTLQRDGVWLA